MLVNSPGNLLCYSYCSLFNPVSSRDLHLQTVLSSHGERFTHSAAIYNYFCHIHTLTEEPSEGKGTLECGLGEAGIEQVSG